MEHGEHIVWSEIVSIEEMYAVRAERQKLVLFEKVSSSFASCYANSSLVARQKLIEDGDEQWILLLSRQISRSVDALIRLKKSHLHYQVDGSPSV